MIIYVYGTGCGAGELADKTLAAEQITAFVDREGGAFFLGRPVISLEELAGRDFDLLIVASRDAERIERDCLCLDISPEKLLFLKNHIRPVDRNCNYDLVRSILGDVFTEKLIGSEKLIRVPLWTEQERIEGDGSDNDYVRLKTLEAISFRLSDVPGAMAEVGVYRGGFARWINFLLPERTLYLFDSFEGFDSEEAAQEGAGFVEAHKNTNIESVLTAMPHAEKVILRQGFFPETAVGLEDERFCLVSLDVDLEESTLAGLRFFLPRINAGGYLLLHDYNNPKLPGVKSALERCEAELGHLRAVPLCDVNGTLVIAV